MIRWKQDYQIQGYCIRLIIDVMCVDVVLFVSHKDMFIIVRVIRAPEWNNTCFLDIAKKQTSVFFKVV